MERRRRSELLEEASWTSDQSGFEPLCPLEKSCSSDDFIALRYQVRRVAQMELWSCSVLGSRLRRHIRVYGVSGFSLCLVNALIAAYHDSERKATGSRCLCSVW